MIVQKSVFAVMAHNPGDGTWFCLGVARSEEDAEKMAADAIDNIRLAYSFREDRIKRAVNEAMDTVRIIPAVLGYDDWDLNRV